MKNIKITQSQLRQLIRESVKEELVREAMLKEGLGDIAGKIFDAIKDFLTKNPELAAKIASGGIKLLTDKIGDFLSEGRRYNRNNYINEIEVPGLESLTSLVGGSGLTSMAGNIVNFLTGGARSLLSKIPGAALGPLGNLLKDKIPDIIKLAQEIAGKGSEGKLQESIKKDVRLVLRRYR